MVVELMFYECALYRFSDHQAKKPTDDLVLDHAGIYYHWPNKYWLISKDINGMDWKLIF